MIVCVGLSVSTELKMVLESESLDGLVSIVFGRGCQTLRDAWLEVASSE